MNKTNNIENINNSDKNDNIDNYFKGISKNQNFYINENENP